MRLPRIKVEGEGFYHVVSRIGARRFLLDDHEKHVLLGMIRRAAGFSGVEVYTHAIMDNHFHLLVRVPRKTEVSEEELRRRVRLLYGPERANLVFAKWDAWERKGKRWLADAEKFRLRARMHDLSQFCKTFKENYTQDYNRRHDSTGTIWEGRFKSILLEGSEGALMSVAAYIHLNPVRAGMVPDASKAPNAGYGAACAGDKASRAGLQGLVARVFGEKAGDWETTCQACSNALEGKIGSCENATEMRIVAPCRKTGVDKTEGEEKLSDTRICGLLKSRRAAFLHGGALGSMEFLKQVATVLPVRKRHRTNCIWDQYAELGLTSAMGIHEEA